MAGGRARITTMIEFDNSLVMGGTFQFAGTRGIYFLQMRSRNSILDVKKFMLRE